MEELTRKREYTTKLVFFYYFVFFLLFGRKVDEDLTLADLMSYLISLTSGQHFYLVYDDVIPGKSTRLWLEDIFLLF